MASMRLRLLSRGCGCGAGWGLWAGGVPRRGGSPRITTPCLRASRMLASIFEKLGLCKWWAGLCVDNVGWA